MQLAQSDLEIETINSRIKRGDIDLQPDFQRGDVWSRNKKRKLIDSILRGWKIPPIHVIEESESAIWHVLDGQQRLTAIRDFTNNKFPVDGYVVPISPKIAEIDKLFFSDLPDSWIRKILSYEIRFIRISNFKPDEPAELFYRLNQPTVLTSAEQRNAFFGKSRDQVKHLVHELISITGGKSSLGFSNARLAYDDVVARLCIYIEKGSVWNTVDAATLTEKYRDEEGFTEETVSSAAKTIKVFSNLISNRDRYIRFNKASLISWLYFIYKSYDPRIDAYDNAVSDLIYKFENERNRQKSSHSSSRQLEDYIIQVYNERISYKVSDPISVATRDLVIWTYFYINSNKEWFSRYFPEQATALRSAQDSYASSDWDNFVIHFDIQKWSKIQ